MLSVDRPSATDNPKRHHNRDRTALAGADGSRHAGWIEIAASVFAGAGSSQREVKTKAQLLIATMEGALLLARIRQSSRPILDIATAY
jgi:hypothetical protein